MSIAIISEFNPFHNGHKLLIKAAKEKFPNEEIVAVMSGDIVQRGDYAISPFDERSEIALRNGIDKIMEIPTEHVIQAAHVFADSAIKIIARGNIDKIFFGSEAGETYGFVSIANKIINNEKRFFEIIKKHMKKGLSFPKASANATLELTGSNAVHPNDILALEYAKSIVKNKYAISMHTIKRVGGFNELTPTKKILSATGIRNKINNNEDISEYVPEIPKIIQNNLAFYWNKIKKKIIVLTPEELRDFKLVSEGIEMLLKKNTNAKTLNEFIDYCTSKRYTANRIRRVIISIWLGIKKIEF